MVFTSIKNNGKFQMNSECTWTTAFRLLPHGREAFREHLANWVKVKKLEQKKKILLLQRDIDRLSNVRYVRHQGGTDRQPEDSTYDPDYSPETQDDGESLK